MTTAILHIPLQGIEWASLTPQDVHDTAARLDGQFRAVVDIVEHGWLKMGQIAKAFQEHPELWQSLGYHTFTEWKESAAPGGYSLRALDYSLHLVTVLADVPADELQQISQANAFVLADGIKSSSVRLEPEVLEAAKKLGKKEFVAKIQASYPQQHVEQDQVLTFHLPEDEYSVVIAVLDYIGKKCDIADRSGQLEQLVEDWRQSNMDEEPIE
jgi:hypothetical protein